MRKFLWCWLPLSIAAGCGDEPASSGSPSSGTGGTALTGTGGSTVSTGGVVAKATGGVGNVSPTGGTPSTGGMKATGGTIGAGGATGGSPSNGGTPTTTGGEKATGGTQTMAGSTSTGGAATAGAGAGGAPPSGNPMPSMGCGKGGRPGNEVTMQGSHIYTFPASYDGTAPMPLIIAMHAANNGNDQLRGITKGTDLEKNFVMAFPKSSGSGWVYNTDRSRIDQRITELTTNYCIDMNRIFATGHSSGAQMIVQMLCGGEQRLRAVAPVASSVYCQKWDNPVPTLLIHGSNDRERGSTSQDADGKKDLAPYVASNGCGTMTTPRTTVMGCSSSGTMVMPGCVDYQGCMQPLTWCSHNDPQYSMTNHGWPCFANAAMNEFFSALK